MRLCGTVYRGGIRLAQINLQLAIIHLRHTAEYDNRAHGRQKIRNQVPSFRFIARYSRAIKSNKEKEIKKVSTLTNAAVPILMIRTDSFNAGVIDRVQARLVRKVPLQGDTSVFSTINFYVYLNLQRLRSL